MDKKLIQQFKISKN